MELKFHNPYVILEIFPVKWFSGQSSAADAKATQATLLLGWSHGYKNSTVGITIWLAITKYPYPKWKWIFYFLRRCFWSSITANTFTGLDCIYDNTVDVL